MKKILLITTILLTLGFFIPNPVLAATLCTGVSCSVGSGEDVILQAVAKDEDGALLINVDVYYTWEIVDPANPNQTDLGTFTSSPSTTCTGAEIVSPNNIRCVETGNNSEAKSTVNLRTSTLSAIDGKVYVTATYGDFTLAKTMVISSSCTRLPVLYYGIASVKVSSTVSWQSSTAEVLETCRNEYKLYGGIGEGN